MTARPLSPRIAPATLRRSIPFWLLIAGSLASIGYGAWLVVDKITTMTATLTDGSATGIEVYAGQSWIVVGAAFIAAGLIGLVTVLALAVVRSFVAVLSPDSAPAPEAADELDDTAADDLGYDPQLGYADSADGDAPSPTVEAGLPETVSTGR